MQCTSIVHPKACWRLLVYAWLAVTAHSQQCLCGLQEGKKPALSLFTIMVEVDDCDGDPVMIHPQIMQRSLSTSLDRAQVPGGISPSPASILSCFKPICLTTLALMMH